MINPQELFETAAAMRASDIHLLASVPPILRIDGKLITVNCLSLSTADIALIFNEITSTEQRNAFQKEHELDFSYHHSKEIHFRVNASRQRASISLVFRLIRNIIPTFEELGLPPICQELACKPNGLVVITGPTGSGKSSTMAAIIGYLNRYHRRTVITVEDPIEYEYESEECVISQREVGFDTHSFAIALKHALRQDPDIILVGEMRDYDTASMVLMAAETGHLVLSTGHAPSAHMSIERIIDLFPAYQQQLAQVRLATVLQGVLCQMLVPRKSGAGRVPAVEIMLGTPAVKNLIREGKIYQLPNVIRTNSQSGMCTMDESLASLYMKSLISREELFTHCNNQSELCGLIGE